jgi:hypothetical protein
MNIEELAEPSAAYFVRRTGYLRDRCEKLETAARAALELLEDPDAEPEAADAVAAALRDALKIPG